MAEVATTHARRWALLALLAGATAIGIAPILVRLSELGPGATAFNRLLFALPVFWVWLGWETRAGSSRTVSPGPIRKGALFVAGVLFALDMAFWHWSLHLTTVANSTLITNAAPIFVTLGAWWWFRERITRMFLIGLSVAVLGAAILSGASFSVSPAQLRGDGVALLAAVFYGGYMLAVKGLRRDHSPLVIMAWSGISSTVTLGLIAWGSEAALWPTTGKGLVILVALALIGQVAGQTLIAFAFKHLPVSFSAVGLLWQPALAALLGWLVLHETMTGPQMLGAVVVLAGIYVCRRGSD